MWKEALDFLHILKKKKRFYYIAETHVFNCFGVHDTVYLLSVCVFNKITYRDGILIRVLRRMILLNCHLREHHPFHFVSTI